MAVEGNVFSEWKQEYFKNSKVNLYLNFETVEVMVDKKINI